MPSRIILDTLSSTDDLPDTLIFDTPLSLKSVSNYLLLPRGSSDDVTGQEPIGSIRWNIEKAAAEFLSSTGWKAFSVEEDWDNVVRSGLTLALDSLDKDSFGGSGNFWINLSKFFTIGGAQGSESVVFDSVENGFLFNATDTYFTLPKDFATIAMSDETGSTYSFWFKSDPNLNYGTGAGDKILFSLWDVNVADVLRIGINPSGGIFYDDATVSTTISSTNYNNNQWYNLVITREYGSGGQNATFYINGVSIGSTTGTSVSYSTTEHIAIGAAYDPGITPLVPIQIFGGVISYIFAYERPLSGQEILSNFNAIKYRYGY